jgi:hypothetical protein
MEKISGDMIHFGNGFDFAGVLDVRANGAAVRNGTQSDAARM